MNKALLFTYAALLVGIPGWQSSGLTAAPWERAANLVVNGGFEDKSLIDPESACPKGVSLWSNVKDEPVAKVYVTRQEKVDGQYSLCIERLNPKGHERVNLAPVPVTPGKRMLFSMMAKSTEGWVEVLFIFCGTDGKPLSGFNDVDVVACTPGTQLTPWGLHLLRGLAPDPGGFNRGEAAFTVPPGAVTLRISLAYGYQAAGEKAWFDDIELITLN
ncbi:MAG: hypothetical protein WAX69_01910 [Victivallales bacterium]